MTLQFTCKEKIPENAFDEYGHQKTISVKFGQIWTDSKGENIKPEDFEMR